MLQGNLKNPNDLSLERIDVIAIFKHGNPHVYKIEHKNKEYRIEKTGLHYTQKVGETLYHIFGLLSENTFFKIAMDTKTLNWKLLEKGYQDN